MKAKRAPVKVQTWWLAFDRGGNLMAGEGTTRREVKLDVEALYPAEADRVGVRYRRFRLVGKP